MFCSTRQRSECEESVRVDGDHEALMNSHALDLWPSSRLKDPLAPSSLDQCYKALATTALQQFKGVARKIQPGMVLLKHALSLPVQQALVDAARMLGIAAGGFYVPSYESGGKMHCHMMCLGQ